MAQHTNQTPDRTTFNPFHYNNSPFSQNMIEENRARNSGIFSQQPEQNSFGCSPTFRTQKRSEFNLMDVSQGLKDLQEKINSTLKRSSSATHLRRPQITFTKEPVSKPVVQNVIQHVPQNNNAQQSFNPIFDPRSRVSSFPSHPPTVKIVSSVPESTKIVQKTSEEFNSQNLHTSASSSNFYLGSAQASLTRKEELLRSIKNYQVKTIHNLNGSSNNSQYVSRDYSHEAHQRRDAYSLGTSSIILNSSNVPIQGYHPGYDRNKLDLIVSKITSNNQSVNGSRQESFVTYMKVGDKPSQHGSHNSSQQFHLSNLPKENVRIMAQQPQVIKASQPVVKRSPLTVSHQRSIVNDRMKQTKTEQHHKGSRYGEVENDGDSIVEFIKEKDELQGFEEGEMRFVRRAKENTPKKLSKRQEIIKSKKLVPKETINEQPLKLRKESSSRSQAVGIQQRNKKRM